MVSACGGMDVDSYLRASIQINSKCIEDLSARPKTTKPLKEKIGVILQYMGTGKSFLNRMLGLEK